jgi:hypothetical protein
LPAENISLGVYSYQIKCQGSGLGGYEKGLFEVGRTGLDISEAESNIAVSSIYFIFFLGSVVLFLGLILLMLSLVRCVVGVSDISSLLPTGLLSLSFLNLLVGHLNHY